MTFYNENQAIKICTENPKMIFELIKKGYIKVVDKVLTDHKDLINTIDENGNTVMMKLLSKKEYRIIINHMKNKYWNVNAQNKDGNTFSHLLVTADYINISQILSQLINNKNFIPNIKNNKNETILDKAIQDNRLYTVTKILKDKRFDNIDIASFKYLYDKCINNQYYGNYSKLNNLDLIVTSLKHKKTLHPKMKELLSKITNNMESIKQELLHNKSDNLEIIIESLI